MTSKGILDTKYALERKTKTELIFRYKTRAQFVADCAQKYLGRRRALDILDFGAAEGLTILELDRLLPSSTITGIEFSLELIDRAVELPANIVLLQGDVTQLSTAVKAKKYDVVSALALLEHLPNPALAVKEAADVLKPGGLFIASSPNPFWDDISTKLGLLRDGQHEVKMTKQTMISITEEASLEVVSFERFMWSPVAVLPYLKMNVNPKFALAVDRAVQKLRVFNPLFVNQAIIARKGD
jgi:2-polyprenyl-3-methyl-5-hydroxy-6-metoxy-1,4-benzoquinol methylase